MRCYWLCLPLLSTAIACSGSEKQVQEPQPGDSGAELFEQVCSGCHYEPEPPRPDFSVAPTPEVATRALRALIEQRMPPATASVRQQLDPANRERLTNWLCLQTNRSPEACDELVHYEIKAKLVRWATTIIGAMTPNPRPTPGLMALYRKLKVGRNIHDAGITTTVLATAIEVCEAEANSNTAANAETGAKQSDTSTCVTERLHLGLQAPKSTAGAIEP